MIDWIARCQRLSAPHEPADFPQKIESLRRLLQKSHLPLVTGLKNLTTEAQQIAVKFADRFSCGVDTGFSETGRDAMFSFQRYGNVTASLGEIKHRSDVVIFWFCDPVETHPRLMDRFIREAANLKKRVLVFDSANTKTAQQADDFVCVSPENALSFVQMLRLDLRKRSDSDATDDTASDSWIDVLATASYGSVFLGRTSGITTGFDAVTDQWFQLVKELNDHTRFVLGGLRNDRNGQGAENVLASVTGFPDAVRFVNGVPAYNGTELSTSSILNRRECDLLIVCDVANVSFESLLDRKTLAWLETIPVVVLSNLEAESYATANLHFQVTTPGWNEAGDFIRLDDVPIPLRSTMTDEDEDQSEGSKNKLLCPSHIFESLLSN